MDTDDRVQALWRDYAPRIEAAAKRDGSERHELFLKLYEENLNGNPAVQLTVEKYLLLEATGSVIGVANVTRFSLLRFLWIVSPQFKESKWRAKWFMWRHRNIDLEKTAVAIAEYLLKSFRYAPPAPPKHTDAKGSAKNEGQGEWVSSLIDLLAHQYGWTYEAILSVPLTQLFMLANRISSRISGEVIKFGSESDALKQEFLHKANALREAS